MSAAMYLLSILETMEACDGIIEADSSMLCGCCTMDTLLARIALAKKLKAQPAPIPLRAMLEEWDMKRVVSEVH